MKKLLSLFGGHRPDAVALSAYVDGRLGAADAAALEAHLTICTACAGRVSELRRVHSMLASMGTVPAPRTFRVHQADVEAPARGAAPAAGVPSGRGGVLAFAPALSAIAVVLLAGVVWADLGTRDGGGSGNGASFPQASAPESMEMGYDERATGGVAADDAGAAATEQPPAAGMMERDDAFDGDAGSGEDAAAPEDTAANAPVPGEGQAATPDSAEILANRFEDTDDDGGVRPGFLALEIALAALAVGAAAVFLVKWWRKREVA